MNNTANIFVRAALIAFFLSMGISSHAQKEDRQNYFSLCPQFEQIKDERNYGQVFSGLKTNLTYSFANSSGNRVFHINAGLGFGAYYNENGGLGLNWKLNPIDIFIGKKVHELKFGTLTIGPYVESNYQWQLYPELTSGHMSWLAFHELGIRLLGDINMISRNFRISIQSHLVALNSRPIELNENYYYSLKISDFINNAHSNISFISLGKTLHSKARMELIRHPEKKLNVAYEFEIMHIDDAADLTILSHGISLKWKLNKS